MVQMGFYHLTRTAPDLALPELLGRTIAAGERAVVLCGSEARVAALDLALWAAPLPDWLPHGSARTGHAALQPIWIAAGAPGDVPECPNGARYLFLLDGVGLVGTGLGDWRRVFDLFDGRDAESVSSARERWAAAKRDGAELTYWRQTEDGWEKG